MGCMSVVEFQLGQEVKEANTVTYESTLAEETKMIWTQMHISGPLANGTRKIKRDGLLTHLC